VREERVHHAVALLELHLPGAASRKDRRGHLQRLRRALVDDLGCSVAEVGGQDSWQRAVLGLTVAAGSASGVQRVLERVVPMAERDPAVIVIRFDTAHDTFGRDG